MAKKRLRMDISACPGGGWNWWVECSGARVAGWAPSCRRAKELISTEAKQMMKKKKRHYGS